MKERVQHESSAVKSAATSNSPVALEMPEQVEPPHPLLVDSPPSARRKKFLIAGIAAFVLGLIALSLYLRNANGVQYTTARVDRGSIEPTITTSGNLNAVITVQVGSQVSGNIIALYADFNTKVKKGQLVALIDPAPFQAAADQAKAALNAAEAGVVTGRATLAKSQSDLASATANVASQKANAVKAQSAAELARLQNERAQALLSARINSQDTADTAKAAYEQALASVGAAEADVTAAEAAAESSAKQVDVAQKQLLQATALAQQASAALAQAQLNLDHTRIVAPVDGTVESRNMDVGQTVAASFQAPIIFLIAQDLTKMQVDTNVDEVDMGPIRVGQQANFTVDAYPGQVFNGKVAQIRQAPINVQNVITYDVVVEVSNPDLRLFPGMTANVTIVTGHVANVLKLPKAALRFRMPAAPSAQSQRPAGTLERATPQSGGLTPVYILNRQKQPERIYVKLGVSDANYVQVVSGPIAEGQQVIVGSNGKRTATSVQTQAAPRRQGF